LGKIFKRKLHALIGEDGAQHLRVAIVLPVRAWGFVN
jgi:hypothetical protein